MQRHLILVSSAAAILSFTSCSQVADSPVPVSKLEIPASYRYKNEYSKTLDENWWVAFKDSKLNELQNQLVKNNLDLEIALENYKASLGALGITAAQLLPTVEAGAEVTRNRDSESIGLPSEAHPTTNMGIKAQLGYEVDLWGRVNQVVRMGKAEADVLRLLIEDVDMAGDLSRGYSSFVLTFLLDCS